MPSRGVFFIHFFLSLFIWRAEITKLQRRVVKTNRKNQSAGWQKKISKYIEREREKVSEASSFRPDARLLAPGHLSETNYFSVVNSL